ncbi:hypothetical protein QJS10_CPB11g00524 [Acorus calamus]|uniref:HMA domain-containing protein n=1 Tax=Acorus calamus TaxID=4465 RepID=A0AAV9DU25_ACOCL|nr:hypothetical protein QJS10_CPB11g00524 [Acorus calamus]
MLECFGRGTMPNSMSIVELGVHMDCDGCEKRIRKAINKLEDKSKPLTVAKKILSHTTLEKVKNVGLSPSTFKDVEDPT